MFRFNDFSQLRSIEFTILTSAPIHFNEFLGPLLSMLPGSMRHITIRFLMHKNAEIEHINWHAFIALFVTSQLAALDCVQLWVYNRQQGSRRAERQAGLIKARLEKYNAPDIFIVRPIDNDAWASGIL